MDFYRKKLKSFGWTWLEYKFCPYHYDQRLTKRRQVTRWARAYAKRNVREEIYMDLDESRDMDHFQEWSDDEVQNWHEWQHPEEWAIWS